MEMPKTRREKSATKSGCVGIFWCRQDQLLAAKVPLADGLGNSVSVNGPFDHITTWPEFQRKLPALKGVEYEDVPRGRVLFLKRAKKFVVYLDKSLMTAAVKAAVLKEFELPPGSTRFAKDPHYTTDPDELERMFDRD